VFCFEKHTYKNAIGYGIWKSKRRYVEIWIFPHGFDISPHYHPDEHIETMLLFGTASFSRKKEGELGVVTFEKTGFFSEMFKFLHIPIGCIHWFVVGPRWPLVVLYFSKFLKGVEPISASINIKFPSETMKG
jgi:hypothetical protein